MNAKTHRQQDKLHELSFISLSLSLLALHWGKLLVH